MAAYKIKSELLISQWGQEDNSVKAAPVQLPLVYLQLRHFL